MKGMLAATQRQTASPTTSEDRRRARTDAKSVRASSIRDYEYHTYSDGTGPKPILAHQEGGTFCFYLGLNTQSMLYGAL